METVVLLRHTHSLNPLSGVVLVIVSLHKLYEITRPKIGLLGVENQVESFWRACAFDYDQAVWETAFCQVRGKSSVSYLL